MNPKLLLSAALLIFSVVPAEAATTAVIRTFEGSVEFKESASGDWKAASVNGRLPAGAVVRTGPASECLIGIGSDGGSDVRMEALSQAEIASLEPVRVNLSSGKIYTMVRKLGRGSTFEVKTPTAIASVRGTIWNQTAEEVNVFDGTVHVAGSKGEELDVPEGRAVETAGGDLSDLKDVSDEEKEKFESFKEEAGGGENADPEEQVSSDPFEDPFDTFGEGLEDAKDVSQEVQEKEDFKNDVMVKKEDKDPNNSGAGNNGNNGGGIGI